MKIDQDLLVCGLLSAIAAVPLLVFWLHNKDTRRIERFFFHNERRTYIALQVAIFVLFTAFILHIRYFAIFFVNALIDKWSPTIMGFEIPKLPTA